MHWTPRRRSVYILGITGAAPVMRIVRGMKLHIPRSALAAAVFLCGCAETHQTSLPEVGLTEPPHSAARSFVLPPLAGVRVDVGGQWLDLYSPPTIDQALLQSTGNSTGERDDPPTVVVTRADGRKVVVGRRAYGSFALGNGDALHIPRRMFP